MEDLPGPPDREACAAPVWVRAERRRRPKLTRAAIVAAAIAIADAEGLEAVSIRRVAAELGARTMSLYTHIDRKEDLLDLMADELTGEVLIEEGALPENWRAAISMIALQERETLLRHPWMGELLGKRSRIGPNALRHLEQSLAAIDGLGVDLPTAFQVVRVVDHYMLGYVVLELLEGKHALQAEAYLREMAESGEFPRLGPLLKGDMPIRGFEQGLTWVLDGIEHNLTDRGRTEDRMRL